MLATVVVTMISEQGAQRLLAVAQGDSTESTDAILGETTETYTRWVAMPGRPW
ncbi:MAG: hypothetical protein J6386_01010 [Candidatus Synoicihabitans palmerolidicus]|nr:hypothetical protein [Candidatus Synoicihabitans palmerolidicus]